MRILSQNPIWLTTVCVGYIQWFLRMMEEISFSELLHGKLGELRKREKMYAGISNAAGWTETEWRNRHREHILPSRGRKNATF